MNLVLRMTKGPNAGIRRVLQDGQRALVGSTAWCDFPTYDESISDPQFSIRCEQDGCWLENLSAATQVSVNGVPVEHKRLADGDIVSTGNSRFIATVRGRESSVQKLQVPLVGTKKFTDQFKRSVVSMLSGSGGPLFEGETMGADLWSESMRLQDSGEGVPGQQLLEALACFRIGALILDRAAVAVLVGPKSNLSLKELYPVGRSSTGQAVTYLLDTKSIGELHQIMERIWGTGHAAFVVPAENAECHREQFSAAPLWKNRSVRQTTRLLINCTPEQRDSLFDYVETIVLPTAEGWKMLSRPIEARLDQSA